MKMNVLNKVKSFGGLTKLKIAKHSPEILLGVGIAAGVGSLVFAIKSTLEVDDVLEDLYQEKNLINYAAETGKLVLPDENHQEVVTDYDPANKTKDLAITYAVHVKDIAKLYAPTIGLGALSLTCVLYSHGIMKSRNVAVTAAYNALSTAFNKYRQNVVERYGEEVDTDMKLGRTRITETVTEVNPETGKKEKVKVEKSTYKDPSEYSEFARFFDETNPCWRPDPNYNRMFLKAAQEHATHLLNARGYVFLNEVYDMIGIDRCPEGQAVGWLKDAGDGFVDFGIYDYESKAAREFVNGQEKSILLDFNVDGVIWDKI